jgi:hypothetical protein
MAQALEAGSYVLYAGTAAPRVSDAAPPDVGEWNWHPLDPDARAVVNAALAASRKAGEELLAGLIR